MRTAEINDSEELRNLIEVTFRDKYTVFNTPENMELHVQKYFGLETIKNEISDTNIRYLVVEIDNKLIGYAKLALDCPAENLGDKRPVEIQRFYVHQNYQGRRIGQNLMQFIFDWSITNQFEVIWLGAWEQNPDALRFYQRLGFEVFGTHKFILGTDIQNDFLLKKEIFPL